MIIHVHVCHFQLWQCIYEYQVQIQATVHIFKGILIPCPSHGHAALIWPVMYEIHKWISDILHVYINIYIKLSKIRTAKPCFRQILVGCYRKYRLAMGHRKYWWQQIMVWYISEGCTTWVHFSIRRQYRYTQLQKGRLKQAIRHKWTNI